MNHESYSNSTLVARNRTNNTKFPLDIRLLIFFEIDQIMRGSKFKVWGTLILVQFSGNNPISWVLRCPILTHTQIGANHPKINHLSIENGDLGIPNFKNFPYSYLYPQYISMISKLYSHILVYIAIISPIMVHKTTTLCSLNHYFC